MNTRGRLLYKMLGFFLALALVPLLFTRLQLVSVSKKSMKQDSLALQNGIAQRASGNVLEYIANIKNMLFVIQGSDAFMSMSPGLHKQMYYGLAESYPLFMEIVTVSKDGRELSRFTRGGGENITREYRQIIREVEEKGEYISKVRFTAEGYPVVAIAVTIGDYPDNKGMIFTEVNLISLGLQVFKDIKIGKQGFAYLIDENGALIARSDIADTQDFVSRKDDFRQSPIVKLILDKNKPQQKNVFQLLGEGMDASGRKNEGGEFVDPKTRKRLLGSYAEVKSEFAGLPWWVVVQQPISEAYATANKMETRINIYMLIVMIITVVLGFIFTRYLVDPIKLLQKESEKLKKGDFNVLVSVNTNDEISELADTFTQMAKSLKDRTGQLQNAKKELEHLNKDLDHLNKNLEHLVDERTKQLREAQEELVKRERLAAVGQMANIIGHEIRNPLSIINNSAYYIKTKLVKLEGQMDEKVVKHIGIIEKEIENSNKIINDLLGFSRTRELKAVYMNANEIFDEIALVLPVPANVKLVQNLDPNLSMTMIDRDEMRQVLLNLIGNGIQAMENGGTVTTSTMVVTDKAYLKTFTDKPAAIRLEVTDTGSGIPPDILEKIFQPFFTTKSKGTGLGLAVVQRVTDRHKGKLEVKSVVGQGTSFFMFIPVTDHIPVQPPQQG
ncbi:MAG: ATP-binding protein [Elusimicrobiota bacterium]